MVALEGYKVAVFGGEHEPRHPIDNAVHVLDVASAHWVRLETSPDHPAPSARYPPPCPSPPPLRPTAHGNDVLLRPNLVPMLTLWWRLRYFAPRVGQAAASVGNRFYMFGGRTGVDQEETSLGTFLHTHIHTHIIRTHTHISYVHTYNINK